MALQQIIINKFKSFKPCSPEVINRSSRDVTLKFSAEPFGFLEDQLIYRVEKKEKIPPWVLVYSGGKTIKTIENLAPSHPHRFRVKIILNSTSKLDQLKDDQKIREEVSKIDESNDCKQANNSSDEHKADPVPGTVSVVPVVPVVPVPSHTMDEKKTLSHTMSEEFQKRQCKWVESQWSEETWTSTDSDGTSAVCFCMAVRCGYLKQVQQMLEERPALISVVNSNNGLTPLATAVRKGELNMVRFLLSSSAEIEQQSLNGQTPLHIAVLTGHISILELLLEKGADFEARDYNKLRIEHFAVDSCNLDVVKFVMDKGGDVTVRDSNGWTPLFRAVCQGAKTEIIEELVRRGSDVEVIDRANLSLAAAARLLKNRYGRRRDSVLRLVDSQFQHEKVVANFTRLTKKISSVHTLLTRKS